MNEFYAGQIVQNVTTTKVGEIRFVLSKGWTIVSTQIQPYGEVLDAWHAGAIVPEYDQKVQLATASAIQMFKDGHRTFEVVRKIKQFGFSLETTQSIVMSVKKSYGVDTGELRGPIPESVR